MWPVHPYLPRLISCEQPNATQCQITRSRIRTVNKRDAERKAAIHADAKARVEEPVFVDLSGHDVEV